MQQTPPPLASHRPPRRTGLAVLGYILLLVGAVCIINAIHLLTSKPAAQFRLPPEFFRDPEASMDREVYRMRERERLTHSGVSSLLPGILFSLVGLGFVLTSRGRASVPPRLPQMPPVAVAPPQAILPLPVTPSPHPPTARPPTAPPPVYARPDPGMRVCSKCHRRISATARFCPRCGAAMDDLGRRSAL